MPPGDVSSPPDAALPNTLKNVAQCVKENGVYLPILPNKKYSLGDSIDYKPVDLKVIYKDKVFTVTFALGGEIVKSKKKPK